VLNRYQSEKVEDSVNNFGFRREGNDCVTAASETQGNEHQQKGADAEWKVEWMKGLSGETDN
jgi:hypothetical protein